MKCGCGHWEENIGKLEGPILLQAIRSGFKQQYKGEPFMFCPWCGSELKEEMEGEWEMFKGELA